MAGRVDVVLTCWPTLPSKRVVVDWQTSAIKSPQEDGGGLRGSGGEALVPVVRCDQALLVRKERECNELVKF
jgi:hypothetical protein